jgi:hypothetical protein
VESFAEPHYFDAATAEARKMIRLWNTEIKSTSDLSEILYMGILIFDITNKMYVHFVTLILAVYCCPVSPNNIFPDTGAIYLFFFCIIVLFIYSAAFFKRGLTQNYSTLAAQRNPLSPYRYPL